jgi:hypothetical protein
MNNFFMLKNPLFEDNSNTNTGLIKSKTIGALFVIFLLAKIVLMLSFPQGRVILASDLTTDTILKAVNNQRALRNLTTLNTNSKLAWAAQSKSDDMQTRHYFAHVDPDGRYIWDKIVAAGYTPYLELGENLAIEFFDTDSLISAWMNSPTHRANLLNDGFMDQGMGLTFGDTALGQYHSAVANTFGMLAPVAKPKITVNPGLSMPAQTTPPAPKKQTAPAPKPKTLGSEQSASSSAPQQSPAVVATPTPQTTLPQPILIRGDEQPAQNNPQSNFLISQTASSTTSTPPVAVAGQPKLAVVGKLQSAALANYQTNRYLILLAGFILLMLMLSDIRTHIQNKLGHLDKKINNIILLAISLIVIAFMYWM